MARSTADIKMIMNVITRPDVRDGTSLPYNDIYYHVNHKILWSNKKIACVKSIPGFTVDSDVEESVEKIVDYLLSQGAQTMGQYYGGQQAAYAPYTTALGQFQNLEQLAQQPLTLSAGLAQQSATAGANVGRLGLLGAGASVDLATGKAATTNPYATALSGLTSNPLLTDALARSLSGVAPVTAMSALPTTFGTGTYYGNQDLMSTFIP